MTSSAIPENTPVQLLVLGCNNENNDNIGLKVHLELGPVYNENLKQNLWLDVGLAYLFGSSCIDLISYDVFTKSFVDNLRRNKEVPLSELIKTACPFCLSNLYRDEFVSLFKKALLEMNKTICDLFGQYQNDFTEAVAASPLYEWVASDTVDIDVDVEVSSSDDTNFSITAQAGPLYDSDDDELLVLFLSSLDYSTLHPDEYCFKHSIMTSYDPADFEDSPSGEITEVDEDSELYEKYADYFEQLETLLMTKLYDTCEDDESLETLSEALEENGFFDDEEDDNDDEGWNFEEDEDGLTGIDVFVDEDED